MAEFINSSQTLTFGAAIYFIDCSAGNITITVPAIDYDYQSYTINRVDNSEHTLNIVLTTNTLSSSETNFNLGGYLSVGIMALNNLWYPVSGATRAIRV